MDCRYFIQIGSESAIDPTQTPPTGVVVLNADECISNLSDVEMSLDRKDLSGLVKKLSNSWEFVGDVRDSLVDYYLSHPLQPKGSILVQCIDPSTFAYVNLWECPLDFAKFSFDSYKCSINCLESGVMALIKAHKSTDYEYDVNDLRETYTSGSDTLPKQLYYDGVKNLKQIKPVISATEVEGNPDRQILYSTTNWNTYVRLPLYFTGTLYSQAVLVQDVAFKDVNFGSMSSTEALRVLTNEDTSFVCEAMRAVTIYVNGEVFANNMVVRPTSASANWWVTIRAVKRHGNNISDDKIIFSKDASGETYNTKSFDLVEGDMLMVYAWVHKEWDGSPNIEIELPMTMPIDIYWGERATPVSLNVIKPLTLLQSLVNSMCGANVADAEIDDTNNSVLSNTLILPAESVRNLDTQKVKTKFNDFCDFMEATFGYVYRVIGVGERNNNLKPIVQFLHRDNLFVKTYTNNRLNATIIKQIAEPQYSVDSSKMYANIEIGYDKQDYDEDNAGRYEFNATNKYTTGCNLTDSTLSLICPYRADSYGLEELVIKTSTTKSTDSDDDIFIIHSNNDTANNRFKLHRSSDFPISGTFDYESNFNVAFAPYYMINRNIKYLRMTTDYMTFVSMDTPSVGVDGTNPISIGGFPINTNIANTIVAPQTEPPLFSGIEPLFMPATIEVRTADISFPSDPNLPIVFNWNEKNYYGYLSSLDINIEREESAKYKLLFYKSVDLPLWTNDAQTNRDHYDEAEDPQINLGDYSNDYNDDYNNGR